MIQQKEIKTRLESISNSFEIDSSKEKVTISKSDFYFLIYGIDELLIEIDKRENYWLDKHLALSEKTLELKKENEKLMRLKDN